MPPEGSAAFPATHHSLLHRLADPDDGHRSAAFDALVRAYRAPIYRYLRLQWRESPEDADDLTQGFLAMAWDRRVLSEFDAGRGRFRTFLRVCLDRYVLNARRADGAQKRTANTPLLSIEAAALEQAIDAQVAAPDADVDAAFHREFIRALFGRTVAQLEADCLQRGRPNRFHVFAAYDLAADTRPSYAAIAASLGTSVTQVTNDLHAARRRFRELALDDLRALCATDEEYRIEAREIFGVTVP